MRRTGVVGGELDSRLRGQPVLAELDPRMATTGQGRDEDAPGPKNPVHLFEPRLLSLQRDMGEHACRADEIEALVGERKRWIWLRHDELDPREVATCPVDLLPVDVGTYETDAVDLTPDAEV